jgi:hypothetical protein
LVGSSSSSTSGAATSACASATRFFMPPDSAATGAAVQVQPLQRGVHALLPGPAVQRLQARLQRIEVVARACCLVARCAAARLGHALATASNTVAPSANCGSCGT